MSNWKEHATQSLLQRQRRVARAESNPDELLFLNEAADIIHVSLKYLTEQVDSGVIPHVGSWPDRRVKASDALKAKAERDARVSAALAEMAALGAEMVED